MTDIVVDKVERGDSYLVKARFGPGMLLEHEDLESLTTYTRELSRLLFRSLFGCGVVCGLVVRPGDKCGQLTVTIEPGVALDCAGDPIHVPKPVTIPIGDDCTAPLPDHLWVWLCGKSKSCAPRTSSCGCDDEDSHPILSRERFGYEIHVASGDFPDCVCGCREDPVPFESEEGCQCANPMDPCYSAHYGGECGCECGDCKDCDCKCVLLAKLVAKDNVWTADHTVRRFVRPVLIANPLPQDATVTLGAAAAAARAVKDEVKEAAKKTLKKGQAEKNGKK